jgi:hypothetical protein
MELVSAEPEGVLPLEEARAGVEATLLLERQMERSREDARAALQRIRAGEVFVNVASDLGLEVRSAGPFARTDFVPGIGRQNAAVGAAFGLAEVGEVSDAVSTPTNTYLIELVQRTPADSLAWRAQIPAQRETVVATLQQQRVQEWITALRDVARVVDRRDVVLQPQDPDAVQMPLIF